MDEHETEQLQPQHNEEKAVAEAENENENVLGSGTSPSANMEVEDGDAEDGAHDGAALDKLMESVEDEINSDETLKHLRVPVKEETNSDEEPLASLRAHRVAGDAGAAAEAWCKNLLLTAEVLFLNAYQSRQLRCMERSCRMQLTPVVITTKSQQQSFQLLYREWLGRLKTQ